MMKNLCVSRLGVLLLLLLVPLQQVTPYQTALTNHWRVLHPISRQASCAHAARRHGVALAACASLTETLQTGRYVCVFLLD